MTLKVGTNIISQMVQRNLRQNEKTAFKEYESLSSGKRLERANEDSARIAISKHLEALERGMAQSRRNANDGISFVQTAEGGLVEINHMLIRLRELSVQASSDTVGDGERGMLDQEYQQLLTEIDRISESSKFNHTVLGTDESKLRFHIGPYQGQEHIIEFDSNNTDASTDYLGVNGSGVSSKNSAQSSIDSVDQAITAVNEQRAEIGAIQGRLHAAVASLEVGQLNHAQARSKIEDVDVAESTAKLASANLIAHSGIFSLVQANSSLMKIKKLVE